MAQDKKNSSACLFLGIGCAVLVALAVAVIGGLSLWGWNKTKELKDPEARAEEVREILGVDRLPEGYYAVMGLKVPLVMEFAILSDREVDLEEGDGDLGDRAFIYFQFLRGKNDDPELRDFFEGRSDDPRVLRKNGVDIDVDVNEILGRGVVDLDPGEALYVATSGSLETNHGRSEGITTISLIQCPGDKRLRVAVWEGPGPAPAPEAEAGATASDLAGTPADVDTLQAFLGQFSFCR